MSGARGANLALRFLLELCMLAALGYWGFHTGGALTADIALGLGAPLLAALTWGLFVSPKAPRRTHGATRLAVEGMLFGAAALALVAAGQPLLGAGFALAVLVNEVLLYLLGGD